jgi:4-hydroxy-3-polyprenylbenzoate decarboxylase
VTPSAIRAEPAVKNQTTDLPRAPATRAQIGHSEPARRNPYAQRTRPLAPDHAVSAPARPAATPRVTPSAIRVEPAVKNQTTDLPRAQATCAQSPGTFPPGDTAEVPPALPSGKLDDPTASGILPHRHIGAARETAVPEGQTNRLIIGISGASGVIYGIRLLQVLRNTPVETHLVISRAAEIALAHETSRKVAEVKAMANVAYAAGDIGAAISSGSYRTNGMIVAPCSIRSMSEIATGVTSTLLTRAADVVLKERRRLVLMVRETPLHTGHLRTMLALSEMGAIVAPPVPAFYANSQTLDDMVDQTIGRVLDLFGIETGLVRRWRED